MTFRVGDSAQNYRLNENVQNMRARMTELQMDVSTGKSARNYADISSEASLLLNSKEQRAVSANFVTRNEQVLDRMQAMEGALSGVADLAERFRNVLVQRLDDAAGSAVPLDTETKAMREQLTSLLNTRLDERYLFAGSQTDQKPVVLPSTSITTVDPTLYYHGDDINLTVRAETDIEIEYGVTADEDAFARLFGTFGRSAEAHASDDHAELEASLQQMTLALDEIAELRGRLGSNGGRLESVTEGQRATVNYLDQTISRIEDTNLPEAISKISADQVNLEATFATLSLIRQLSLVDYLR